MTGQTKYKLYIFSFILIYWQGNVEIYLTLSFAISLGGVEVENLALTSQPHSTLTANGAAALWVPLHPRGLVVTLCMSACHSLLAAKNKMLNPSKNLPPVSLHLLSRLNRETKRLHLCHQLHCNSSVSHRHLGGNCQNLKKLCYAMKLLPLWSFTSVSVEGWCAGDISFQGLFMKVGFWSKISEYFRMAVMPWFVNSNQKQQFPVSTGSGDRSPRSSVAADKLNFKLL